MQIDTFGPIGIESSTTYRHCGVNEIKCSVLLGYCLRVFVWKSEWNSCDRSIVCTVCGVCGGFFSPPFHFSAGPNPLFNEGTMLYPETLAPPLPHKRETHTHSLQHWHWVWNKRVIHGQSGHFIPMASTEGYCDNETLQDETAWRIKRARPLGCVLNLINIRFGEIIAKPDWPPHNLGSLSDRKTFTYY